MNEGVWFCSRKLKPVGRNKLLLLNTHLVPKQFRQNKLICYIIANLMPKSAGQNNVLCYLPKHKQCQSQFGQHKVFCYLPKQKPCANAISLKKAS